MSSLHLPISWCWRKEPLHSYATRKSYIMFQGGHYLCQSTCWTNFKNLFSYIIANTLLIQFKAKSNTYIIYHIPISNLVVKLGKGNRKTEWQCFQHILSSSIFNTVFSFWRDCPLWYWGIGGGDNSPLYLGQSKLFTWIHAMESLDECLFD